MLASYRTVLIAVDGAKDCDWLLERAGTLLDRVHDRCRVMTVIPPLPVLLPADESSSAIAGDSARLQARLQDGLNLQVTQAVQETVARYGISPDEVTVRVGRPADEICAYAAETDADLLVIGRNGPPFIGATAEAVLNVAGCDVLTVPPDEPE